MLSGYLSNFLSISNYIGIDECNFLTLYKIRILSRQCICRGSYNISESCMKFECIIESYMLWPLMECTMGGENKAE